MTTPRPSLVPILLLPLLLAVSGCATIGLPWSKDRVVRATANNPAVQVLCLWQPSTGRDPDGLPCRGFAGQIIFLSGVNTTPLAVDGDVRIYVFDDQGTLEERSVPRLWDFDSGAWNMHLTNSSLGAAYSVFIPYTRPGSQQTSCTLRLRLTPKQGQPIFSETASVILPGRKVVDTIEQSTDVTSAKSGSSVWMSDSSGIVANSPDSMKMLRKTTIPMDSRLKIRDEQNGVIQETAFAGGATEPASADPVSARLDRLEQLLERSLTLQQAAPVEQSGIVQAAYESMSPEVDSMPPGTSPRELARRPSFRGDRNSGGPSGDGVSVPSVSRLRAGTHPLATDLAEDRPAPPRQLRNNSDARELPAGHPLADE